MRLPLASWFRESRQLQLDALASVYLKEEMQGLPWTAAALRPSALLSVLNIAQMIRPTNVVQFGPGLDSVVLWRRSAKLNQPMRWVGVEENGLWIENLEMYAPRAGSIDVDVIECPISDEALLDGSLSSQWRTAVADALGGALAELVLVDGPATSGSARAGARRETVASIADAIDSSACIFLDDTHRKDERRAIRSWQTHFFPQHTLVERWTYSWLVPQGMPSFLLD